MQLFPNEQFLYIYDKMLVLIILVQQSIVSSEIRPIGYVVI